MEEGFSAILEVFSILLRYRGELLKKLLFPFSLLCISVTIRGFLEPGSMVSWLLLPVDWVLMAVIAVTVHRVVITGPFSLPKWGIARLSIREIRFVSYELIVFGGLAAAYAVVAYPVMRWFMFESGSVWLLSMGMMLWLVFLFLVAMRFFLVFPGVAVEENPGFRGSWELTRNRKLFLFMVAVVLPAILWGIAELIYFVPGLIYLSTLVSTLMYIIEVAALSVVYTRICGQPGSGRATQVEF